MAKTSYYVVMLDHGRIGCEANVSPEITRRGVIDRIVSGEYPIDDIVFIHFIDETGVEDVTEALKSEAGQDFTERLMPSDRLAWLHDRARDERKHGVC